LTTEEKRAPWWLWPNLLSLDAPLVALAWLWVFSDRWGLVNLPGQLWWVLASSVRAIYVIDRLIDNLLKVVAVLVLACAAWMSLGVLSKTLLFYGVGLLIFVAAYFAMASSKGGSDDEVTKNFLAGVVFAYGTAAGAHAYSPLSLCILNICAIDAWELGGEEGEAGVVVIGFFAMLLAAIAVFFSMQSESYAKPFFYAVLVGAAGMYALNRVQGSMGSDLRRVLADVAILLPVGFYALWA